MFPSMEIFLMRVPSALVAGEGQLLLGGVAMPRQGAARARQAGGWEMDTAGYSRRRRRAAGRTPARHWASRRRVSDLILARAEAAADGGGPAAGPPAQRGGHAPPAPSSSSERRLGPLSVRPPSPGPRGATHKEDLARAEGGAARVTTQARRFRGRRRGGAGRGEGARRVGVSRVVETPESWERGGRPRAEGVACRGHRGWAWGTGLCSGASR